MRRKLKKLPFEVALEIMKSEDVQNAIVEMKSNMIMKKGNWTKEDLEKAAIN